MLLSFDSDTVHLWFLLLLLHPVLSSTLLFHCQIKNLNNTVNLFDVALTLVLTLAKQVLFDAMCRV